MLNRGGERAPRPVGALETGHHKSFWAEAVGRREQRANEVRVGPPRLVDRESPARVRRWGRRGDLDLLRLPGRPRHHPALSPPSPLAVVLEVVPGQLVGHRGDVPQPRGLPDGALVPRALPLPLRLLRTFRHQATDSQLLHPISVPPHVLPPELLVRRTPAFVVVVIVAASAAIPNRRGPRRRHRSIDVLRVRSLPPLAPSRQKKEKKTLEAFPRKTGRSEITVSLGVTWPQLVVRRFDHAGRRDGGASGAG